MEQILHLGTFCWRHIDCRTVQFVQSTKSDPNINSTVQMFYNSSNVDSPKPSTAQSGSQATNGLQNVIKSCKINKIKILGEIFILLFVFKPLHDFKQLKVRQFIEISFPGKTRSKILVLSTALFEWHCNDYDDNKRWYVVVNVSSDLDGWKHMNSSPGVWVDWTTWAPHTHTDTH